MNNQNPISLKSVGVFLVILFTGMLVTVVMLNTTDKNGNKNDLRSHASDPSDMVVDSDALLEASEKAFFEQENDKELTEDTDTEMDEADEAEVNAL